MKRAHFVVLLIAVVAAALLVERGLAAFTAASVGLDVPGDKEGGLAWGDFNNDGCLDALVNTNDASTQFTRLYRSDCSLPNPGFTDVTSSHAAGLLLNRTERSAIWGDINNDGYLDFARNTSGRIEIYINNGPFAGPAYSFGDASQNPDQILTAISTIAADLNSEFMGWVDYDSDGDLDLIIDNHDDGIIPFANDGSGSFTEVNPATLGLPGASSSASGDYGAATDFDADGDVDLLIRKQAASDLYAGTGSMFGSPTNIANATNSNKGGAAFCDFDDDGDFDLFWTDNPTNQIWRQAPLGTFIATGLPSGITGDMDGVACGDVDNDGDLDLFLTADGGDLLYLNTSSGGSLSFTQNNLGITGSADGEGAAFGDYDRDGDLDLLINQDGANELWRNDANDGGADNYLFVRALYDVDGAGPGTTTRDAIGATLRLQDCAGSDVSGVREVNGGRGHGSQDPAYVHFGLPSGANLPYVVRVQFVGGTVRRRAIVPSSIADYQLVSVVDTDADDLAACAAPTPTSTPSATATETSTMTPSPTATSTQTPSPTPTSTPTPSPTPTSTQTASPSPTFTPSLTPSPTSSATPTTTLTPTPSPTLSPTPTATLPPEIVDPKVDALVEDNDGNGVASAGDVLEYILTISNEGGSTALGVSMSDTPDANTTLLNGTVITTQGTVILGNNPGDVSILIDIGALSPGVTVTITFRASINDPLPPGTESVSNQGVVSGGNFPDSPTDDPGTSSSDDATRTVLFPPALSLPETGFAPGRITALPAQPHGPAYSSTQIWLEIPKLELRTSIAGVPLDSSGWDVSWLGGQAGYLEGTAFPTWSGNTVLTGHVYLADGNPGPFADLGSLEWGDELVLEAFGLRYIYQVRRMRYTKPEDLSLLEHEQQDWLTLITCYLFDPAQEGYRWRLGVQAVRVGEQAEGDQAATP